MVQVLLPSKVGRIVLSPQPPHNNTHGKKKGRGGQKHNFLLSLNRCLHYATISYLKDLGFGCSIWVQKSTGRDLLVLTALLEKEKWQGWMLLGWKEYKLLISLINHSGSLPCHELSTLEYLLGCSHFFRLIFSFLLQGYHILLSACEILNVCRERFFLCVFVLERTNTKNRGIIYASKQTIIKTLQFSLGAWLQIHLCIKLTWE